MTIEEFLFSAREGRAQRLSGGAIIDLWTFSRRECPVFRLVSGPKRHLLRTTLHWCKTHSQHLDQMPSGWPQPGPLLVTHRYTLTRKHPHTHTHTHHTHTHTLQAKFVLQLQVMGPTICLLCSTFSVLSCAFCPKLLLEILFTSLAGNGCSTCSLSHGSSTRQLSQSPAT